MLIYKICHRDEWAEAEREGAYRGTPKDREDGFLHFSKLNQVPGTLAKYYAGQDDLMLVAVDADQLGAALIHEASRDGDLFPHLYGTLMLSAVRWAKAIVLNADGSFTLPEK